ncbi:hypothetical protein KM043_000451 [Ampulex compressa]|nr:hypothetical protein KM043_000451 [Ampulex compressa]
MGFRRAEKEDADTRWTMADGGGRERRGGISSEGRRYGMARPSRGSERPGAVRAREAGAESRKSPSEGGEKDEGWNSRRREKGRVDWIRSENLRTRFARRGLAQVRGAGQCPLRVGQSLLSCSPGFRLSGGKAEREPAVGGKGPKRAEEGGKVRRRGERVEKGGKGRKREEKGGKGRKGAERSAKERGGRRPSLLSRSAVLALGRRRREDEAVERGARRRGALIGRSRLPARMSRVARGPENARGFSEKKGREGGKKGRREEGKRGRGEEGKKGRREGSEEERKEGRKEGGKEGRREERKGGGAEIRARKEARAEG